MTTRASRTRSASGWSAGILIAALLLTGCGVDAGQPDDASPSSSATSSVPAPAVAPTVAPDGPGEATPSGTAADASAASAGRVQDPTADTGTSDVAAAPTRVRIPSIGVDAPLETLSVDADNALQPPVAWEAAGWYDQSPVPGERGPSVIAGHLVAPDGPAVFVDLGALVPGDRVEVERADGSIVTFAVNRTISAERTDSFPTSEIYGPTPDAQLRLITCDGEYDPARGHWTRNMVVFASEVTG